MHWSGKIALLQQKQVKFLVDNDISPDIAKALGLFDFEILHVQNIEQFCNKNRPEGVEDPEIIQWCGINGYVWITHDKKAKKLHDPILKSSRISVLWIRGQTDAFATWQQFKIIIRVIDELKKKLIYAHGAIHFQASTRGTPTPTIIWAEKPQDRPHNSGD